MISILYDGWPLSYSPNSPGALHLLTLLEARPEGFEPILALPAAPPAWLPDISRTVVARVENNPSGRLMWEQRRLPGLAHQVGANLVHLTSWSPALFAPVQSIISPAGFGSSQSQESPFSFTSSREGWEAGEPEGLSERLRRSLSRGTQERILGLFWPTDLAYPSQEVEPGYLRKLPPIVHPAFLEGNHQETQGIPCDLPETYLLYQGPYNRISIQTLLNAWSWAAGPVGDSCPLVLAGVPEDRREPLEQLLEPSGLGDSLRILAPLAPGELAALYRASKGLFHSGSLSVWEGPLRHALACGRAIIAAQSPPAEDLLGPAAYLVPKEDFRGMGAAMITVVLEEEVEVSLSKAARARSAGWDMGLFQEQLARAYRELAKMA